MTFSLEPNIETEFVIPFEDCEPCPMRPINNAKHTNVCIQCKKDRSPIGIPCEHCNSLWIKRS